MKVEVKTYRDPLLLTMDITQQRHKAVILWEMEKKKQEYSNLTANLPGIKPITIMEELNELIELGLVSRIVHIRRKSQLIEYALTNRGAMLLKCLRKMMNVGVEIMMDYDMNEYLLQEGYIEKIEDTLDFEEDTCNDFQNEIC